MDLRKRQKLAMELFQLASEEDPLRTNSDLSKLSRKRFCLMYIKSICMAGFAFGFLLITYNTENIAEVLKILINSTVV